MRFNREVAPRTYDETKFLFFCYIFTWYVSFPQNCVFLVHVQFAPHKLTMNHVRPCMKCERGFECGLFPIRISSLYLRRKISIFERHPWANWNLVFIFDRQPENCGHRTLAVSVCQEYFMICVALVIDIPCRMFYCLLLSKTMLICKALTSSKRKIRV